ncbi:MAG TPA: 23S rRNA (guanosine(2251)-2'-O)-methyltransferase RlmB [Clostridiales bacterium]|nr:23S rRNA (guanosine(2251)-2'-O)-methyltransferase RlmB [Clostridiales bacterium]
MQLIKSENNPLIKEVKALKTKKYREQKKLYFIEGLKFVEEALLSGADITKIFISETLEINGKISGIKLITSKEEPIEYDIYVVPDNLFKGMSDTGTPQGILAVVKMRNYTMDDIIALKNNKDNLFVVLDSIQDPGNMGTIIRTADAADFTAIIVSKGCVDFYNPKVLRSTMGSIFHIPVVFCDNLADVLKYFRSQGIKTYAAHLNGTVSYFNVNMSNNAAIIIGNEANGISNETASLADIFIKIPMPGSAESLNASVAAGVLIYESVRQRS